MNPFAHLSEALLLLGSALDPQAISRVTFQVVHQPTDHPSLGNPWAVTAIVTGTTGVPNQEEGTLPSVAFEEQFTSENATFEEAHQQVCTAVRDRLERLHSIRTDGARSAELGLSVLARGPRNISEIWEAHERPERAVVPEPSPTQGPSAEWEAIERAAQGS